ncbi:MAG: metallophosphoesterase [Sedimentisphaerales bacterium]|nr:metallophosphoesterase [Sedimentisphaerales bacterium]
MAAVFHKNMNRRDFVKAGLAGIGAIVTLGGCRSLGTGQARNGPPTVRWALLSDTHVPEDVNDNYRGFYPYRGLEKAVPEVISNSPDAVAITGDLARLTGKEGDYANFKKLLTPLVEQKPVFTALGNHDDRGNFLKTFDKLPGENPSVSGKCVLVANTPPVRLIMLDSLLFVNKTPGLLGRAQRRWLADYLKNSDNTPTILCFHHTLSDGDGDLLDLPRLYELIRRVRKVKAIVYGHSHEYGFSKYKGIHLINLPSTAYNFNDRDPIGWVEARLRATGGDFTLHATGGNKERHGSIKHLVWRS